MQPYKAWMIQDVIEKNKRVFKIPVYQRNYDWNNIQCEKLYDDVLIAFDKDKKHFVGSVVYIKGEYASSRLEEALIIDGQQRITTIYILLKAMLDVAKEIKEVRIEEELEDYLYNRRCDEKYKLKLKPVKSDNEQLWLLMKDKFDECDVNSNIIRNYNLFKKLINNSLRKGLLLGDILEGLKKLEIVEIILDTSQGDEPQAIFESINSTGLELSLADLIRNFLLMDDKNQDELFENYWLPMEKKIGYSNLAEYFIQYLNYKIGDSVNSKNAYEKFKHYYYDNFDSHEGFLKDLLHNSSFYAAFIGRDNKFSKEVNVYLDDFRTLDQSTMYPFLFAMFNDFSECIINESVLLKVLSLLRSYSLRRIVCEVPSNSLRGFFKTLYNRLFKDQDYKNLYYETICNFLLTVRSRDRIVDDNEFRLCLMSKPLYLKKKACKYILGVIENNGKEKIDVSSMTVEHILPQKEDALVWKKEVGDDYKHVYETYLHTIGNLTVTGYNSELGTKPFAEKKKIIKEKSKANKLNEFILNCDRWNEESILLRAEALTNTVLDIFSFEIVSFATQPVKEEGKTFNVDSGLDFVNTKPVAFNFYGENVKVSNYAEMLSKFIGLLNDLDSKRFEELAKSKLKVTSSDRVYVTFDIKDLRRPKEINNSGIYYETNLSSNSICHFIKTLIECFELDVNEFEFTIE